MPEFREGAQGRVWTEDDIRALPDWGDADNGWFYGLVHNRERGRIQLAEIYPGMGYADIWPMWNPKSWWWLVCDIRRHRPSRAVRVESA